MLAWTPIFLVIALFTAVFGIAGITVAAVGIAKIILFVTFVLFLLSLIFGMRRREMV